MASRNLRCTEQEKEHARSSPAYWKARHNLESIFASELAFSLIYDNIKHELSGRALATMGLAVLPDVMLLVQVDDYVSKYSEIKVTREFTVKAAVRICMQEVIDSSCYVGFAANLIGLDTLVCFLCLPEYTDISLCMHGLTEFSEQLCHAVLEKTGISVTVCISDFCHGLSDYPTAYVKARELLYNSFYMGKSAKVVSGQTDSIRRRSTLSRYMDYYPQICVAISKGDGEQFAGIIQSVCTLIREANIPPRQSKTNLAGFLQAMEVYAENCGLQNRAAVSAMTAKYAELIQKSGYLEDAAQYLKEYFHLLGKEMVKIPGRGRTQAFQEPIVEYVSNHFGEEIMLRDLAALTGYSTYYFTRIFKKSFGCTLTEYLMRFRIEQSKKMLVSQTDRINEIAARCGFDNANYFSNCFRKQVGTAPSEYRRINRL